LGHRVYERRALIDQLFAIRQTAASIAIDAGWACSAATTRPFLPTDVDRSAFFIALVVVDVLAGLADSLSGPYVVLFLVDQARLGPLALSAVLTARALGGIAFATGFGAWIDRRTSVRPLLLALAGSSVGYALLGFTKDFALLLAIAAIPMAIGGAAFSQSIALVKRHFDHANLYTANRAIGVLRASWSLAWAIGPAIGAAVVGALGFRGAFFTSAASGVAALIALALVRARPVFRDAAQGHRPKPANGGPAIALAFAGLALFHTALFMGSIPLAIVVTTSLGGMTSDVGLMYSLCAALEIVVMGALIWRPLKRGERTAIVAGFAVFVAYFVVLALARSVGPVFWAQILRAIAIGLVTYLGIGFLQSLLPHRPGAAAALFSNAGQLGSVVAALGAGALAQAFGYASIFAACAILSAAGLVMICLVRPEPG
jgi:MFS transporter, SET family, sugar efflux transporter